MKCRVLKNKSCIITQYYNQNHQAIDLVGENSTLDYIVAHSNGIIIELKDGLRNLKGTNSYGNYVKIDHQNGYHTLYAHLQSGLPVKKGQKVQKGQTIGYMSDSGNAYGAHLHFEIIEQNRKINPLNYINEELPNTLDETQKENNIRYKVGDEVEINGVYISSTSKNKLRPLVKTGTITKIIQNAENPYLLNNGEIGWVNNNTITSLQKNNYLINKSYQGSSIVDALKEINIDSSFASRKSIAKKNNINNYTGTSIQNTTILNLLKNGKLKY